MKNDCGIEESTSADSQTTAIDPTNQARVYESEACPFEPDQLASLVQTNLKRLVEIGGITAIAHAMRSDTEEGFNPNLEHIEMSRSTHGANVLPPVAFKSFLQLVWETLQDRTLIMLLVAAAISLAVGMSTKDPEEGFVDGTAVAVAVAIVVLITALNDYQKERQFRTLNSKKNDRQVVVVRGGNTMHISVFDVVVGDVVVLAAGDVIPADGVLIEGQQLQCDESSATGESSTIRKGDPAESQDPFLLSGTQVVEGRGSMLVVAVGERSYNGRLLLALRTPTPETPLQRKLSKLANIIGNFGVIAAVIIFTVGKFDTYLFVHFD